MSRKSVLWMAVLCILPAIGAAQTLPVKVSGVVHVSTDLLDNGDQSEVFVSSNTTRLTLSGSMDTDNDLFTVIWQWESQVDFNANGNERALWATRNSFAGLQGDWGKVIWGRYDTPFKSVGRMVEFFPERVGDARNATRLDQVGYGWDERPTNMLMYWTPKLADYVTVAAQFAPDQGVESGQAFSGSVMYDSEVDNVGLRAAAAVEVHGKGLEAAPMATAKSATGIRAAVRYRAAEYAVGGMFQTISNIAGYDGISAQTYGVGASYRVAPEWDLKGQFYLVDPNTDGDNDGANLLALGVDYVLSDAARIYLTYAAMMNQDAQNVFVPWDGGHGQGMPLADIFPYGAASVDEDLGLTLFGISAGVVANF